ncbi:hypothetical protein Sjap_008228 [Stephania japonica]|uniref:Uncharacterized protein n=1 Tax=Stephania japonica TaxID=461633 RepID=A0AAP0PC40_9MAGN
MADQRGPSDDSGRSSTRAVSIEEFQALMQRVAAHERQLEEILVILRASVVVASVPSMARVTITQEANIPGVTTMTLLPSTTSTTPVMAVVPRTLTVYDTTATIEARQWREFKRHDPIVFYGGTDLTMGYPALKEESIAREVKNRCRPLSDRENRSTRKVKNRHATMTDSIQGTQGDAMDQDEGLEQ